MSRHFPGNRASVHVAIAPEDKCHNNKCLSSSFLLAFIVEQMSYGMEYHFVHFESAVLAMSPPKTLPTLTLLVRGDCWRDSLDAVQALLSSNQNTDVLSTPF